MNNTATKPNHAQRDIAVAFAEAGFNLIELHPMTSEGGCTCWREEQGQGCNQSGKHPVAKKDVRPDYRKHTALLDLHLDLGRFDHGFGALLDDARVLVIDVDARNGGLRGFEKLAADFPEVTGAGMIVETGSGDGSRHLYFSLPKGVRLKSSLKDYQGIDFKSSGWVVAPGSKHKSGNTYLLAHGGLDDIDLAPAALIDALRKPERKGPALRLIEGGLSFGEVDAEELVDMLSFIESEGYDDWFAVGRSIYGALGDSGFQIWDKWSSEASNYCLDAVAAKWDSECSKADPGGIGFIAKLARENGWRPAFEREIDHLHRIDMEAVAAVAGTFGQTQLTRSGLPVNSDVFGWHPRHGLVCWALDASGDRTGFVSLGDKDTAPEWHVADFESFVRLPALNAASEIREVLAVSDIRRAVTTWSKAGREVEIWAIGGSMVVPSAMKAAEERGVTVYYAEGL